MLIDTLDSGLLLSRLPLFFPGQIISWKRLKGESKKAIASFVAIEMQISFLTWQLI
jgi:hypothetical protein